MQMPVLIDLANRILAGQPTSGNACLLAGTGDPVASPPCNVALYVDVGSANIGVGGTQCDLTYTYTAQGWYNFVFGKTSGTGFFYVNGSVAESKSAAGTVTSSGHAFLIGNGRDTAFGYFHGSVAGVRYYSRALSSTEITTVYNNGLTGGIW